MLTAADRLDDKATGFGLGVDDYLTKPFEFQELVLRLRALDRRHARSQPPVQEIAGLQLDPFRREVHRDGHYIALTGTQFAVLEVLIAAEGGVVSAEELLNRAWDESANPFANAVRITVSALRKRLAEPGIIATVAGVGYRIDAQPDTGPKEGLVDRAFGLRMRRLSLARLAPRRLLHLPLRTVRLRLTLLYSGLFLVSGVALLATTYLLFRSSTGVDLIVPTVTPHGSTSPAAHNGALPNPNAIRQVRQMYAAAVARNTHGLHQGLIQSGIALAIMTAVSIALGWLVAGRVLRPLRTMTATTRQISERNLNERLALSGPRDELKDLADTVDGLLARLEAHVSEQQRFAANASHELRTPLAITQTLLDVARNDQSRGNDELVDRLRAVNTRAIDLTEALLLLSHAVLHPRTRRPVPDSRRSHRDAPPLRRKAWRRHRDPRRRDPRQRLARAPAADGDEPRAQRDRPQPARTGHRMGHDPRSPQDCGAHGREHRPTAHPTAGRHACRAVPARLQAHNAPTTQASASAWQSSRPSPKHTTEPSPPPRPPAGSASRCNYPPRHRTPADDDQGNCRTPREGTGDCRTAARPEGTSAVAVRPARARMQVSCASAPWTCSSPDSRLPAVFARPWALRQRRTRGTAHRSRL